MWAGRSTPASSQTRTRTSIRAHTMLPKRSYSMLTVLVLFCCTFLVVVDIEVVTSMSLDRLGIDRSNEIQSDKQTDTSDHQRISELAVEDEELEAVPIGGETAMYVLLPAGSASERESVNKNTIESDEVEPAHMSENASDMVMMETNDAPAVQIVDLPPSSIGQEIEKDEKEKEKETKTETKIENKTEIEENSHLNSKEEEVSKPITSDENEDEPIKQVFKNDKDIEDMAVESESDRERDSGEENLVAAQPDSDEEPESMVEMFADVVEQVEKEIETELVGDETEIANDKVVSPVDKEHAQWEATVEKLAEKGSEKEKEKEKEEENDIELEAAAVMEEIFPAEVVEAMTLAEATENSSEEKTENEEETIKDQNVSSSLAEEPHKEASVEVKPTENIPEEQKVDSSFEKVQLEDNKLSIDENVDEIKTEEEPIKENEEEKQEEHHEEDNNVEETEVEEIPNEVNNEETKIGVQNIEEQEIPQVEENVKEDEIKTEAETQLVEEVAKPIETVLLDTASVETEHILEENSQQIAEIKPTETEVEVESLQQASQEIAQIIEETVEKEEETVQEPDEIIQQDVEVNKENELLETPEEPLKLETAEKVEETETENETIAEEVQPEGITIENAVEVETVKEDEVADKESHEDTQQTAEVNETAPKIEKIELQDQAEPEPNQTLEEETSNVVEQDELAPISEINEVPQTQAVEENPVPETTIIDKIEDEIPETQSNEEKPIQLDEPIFENEHKIEQPAEAVKPAKSELPHEQEQHEFTPQTTEEHAYEVTENADEPTMLTTIIQMPAEQQQKQEQEEEKEHEKIEEEEEKVPEEIQQNEDNEMHAPPSHVQNEQIPVVEPVASTQVTIESSTQRPQIITAAATQDTVLNYVNATNAMAALNVEKEQQKQQQLQQATESAYDNETTFNSQLRRYDGAQVWRIVVQSDRDRRLADELQTKYDGQLWKEVKQEVDYLLKPQVLADAEKHIRAANLSRIVLIDNLQNVIEVENPMLDEIADADNENGHRLTWQAYHRLADIHDFFDYLAKTYPEICAVETIGYSIQKRPLKVLKISNGNAGNPGVWIDGGMHAREWISPASVTYIANQLAEGWEDLPSYMQNINWYIHAVANPDGYEYSHTTDRLWRKNMRSHGRQCPGVDLNRNFGYKWGGKGTSANPCSQTYRGSKAFSEPETFYISKFISNFPRDTFQAFLSFHSYGQYILYPWGFDYMLTYDKSDLDRVGRAAATTITRSTGMKYTVGPSAVTLYPAAGGSDDWAKGIAQIKYTYTIEMGDTGRYGFILPASHIEPNGKDAYTFVQTVARAISHDVRKRTIKLK